MYGYDQRGRILEKTLDPPASQELPKIELPTGQVDAYHPAMLLFAEAKAQPPVPQAMSRTDEPSATRSTTTLRHSVNGGSNKR